MRYLHIFVTCLLSYATGASLPSYIKKCKFGDSANYHDCIMRNVELVRPRMTHAIPELNLRRLEPLHITEMTLNFGGEQAKSIHVDTIIRDVKVHGLSKARLERVSMDFSNWNTTWSGGVDEGAIEGIYTMKGKILLIPIDSSGAFRLKWNGINLDTHWLGKKVMKNGAEHLHFDNTYVDLQVKNITMQLDNLFPSNPELGENTNRLINENVDILFNDVKPVLEEAMKTILYDMIASIYDKFSINEMYD